MFSCMQILGTPIDSNLDRFFSPDTAIVSYLSVITSKINVLKCGLTFANNTDAAGSIAVAKYSVCHDYVPL